MCVYVFVCVVCVFVNYDLSLLIWAFLFKSNILIKADQWAFPCNCGSFHMHCSVAVCSSFVKNTCSSDWLLLYKQIFKNDWISPVIWPVWSWLHQLKLKFNPERSEDVWSLWPNHMLQKWPWDSPVFVQRGLPAGPGASRHPWCPQTGLSPPEAGHAAWKTSTQMSFYFQNVFSNNMLNEHT